MITTQVNAHSIYFTLGLGPPRLPNGKGALMIHATRSGKSGNPSEFQGTINWFRNPANPDRSSCHVLIDRDGTRARIVNDDCRSHHAGQHNATHFGIELCQGVESDGFTQEQLDSLVEVCLQYAHDFDIDRVHATHAGMSGFIGHEESAQGRAAGKSDPGRLFPWAYFESRLSIPRDTTLDVIPSRAGQRVVVYPYVVEYNADGVPIWRIGGVSPGATAKNYGGVWVYHRNLGNGVAYWSAEAGD